MSVHGCNVPSALTQIEADRVGQSAGVLTQEEYSSPRNYSSVILYLYVTRQPFYCPSRAFHSETTLFFFFFFFFFFFEIFPELLNEELRRKEESLEVNYASFKPQKNRKGAIRRK